MRERRKITCPENLFKCRKKTSPIGGQGASSAASSLTAGTISNKLVYNALLASKSSSIFENIAVISSKKKVLKEKKDRKERKELSVPSLDTDVNLWSGTLNIFRCEYLILRGEEKRKSEESKSEQRKREEKKRREKQRR